MAYGDKNWEEERRLQKENWEKEQEVMEASKFRLDVTDGWDHELFFYFYKDKPKMCCACVDEGIAGTEELTKKDLDLMEEFIKKARVKSNMRSVV